MYVIKTAAVLFITAVITTALLSFAHTLTLEPIARQAKKTQEAAMREVLTQASEFQEIPSEPDGNIVRIFAGVRDGETVGYLVELAPEGYSGSISMIVGISSADEKLAGMRVLKHTETPGLGALAVKENFYRKYDNRELSTLTVVRTVPTGDEIDAITSATITTRAITGAVNEAIEWYNGGGGR